VGTKVATDVRVSNRRGRPNYPLEFKHRLAVAASEPGVSVAKLSLAHGINANMLFKWRRQYRAGELTVAGAAGVTLIPVSSTSGTLEPVEASEPAPIAPSIEIDIAGATIRLRGAVDDLQLRMVLRCLGRSA
jgi:transposase